MGSSYTNFYALLKLSFNYIIVFVWELVGELVGWFAHVEFHICKSLMEYVWRCERRTFYVDLFETRATSHMSQEPRLCNGEDP